MTMEFFGEYQRAVVAGLTSGAFDRVMRAVDASRFNDVASYAKEVAETALKLVAPHLFDEKPEPDDDNDEPDITTDRTKSWGSSSLLARSQRAKGINNLWTVLFKIGILGIHSLSSRWTLEFLRNEGLGVVHGIRQIKHVTRIEAAFATLFLNLVVCVHCAREQDRPHGLAISMTNAWYVLPLAWGARLKDVVRRKEMNEAVEFLVAGGWIVKRRGYHDPKTGEGRRTILIPTDKLVAEMITIDPADVRVLDWYPKSQVILRDADKNPIAFEPTDETRQMEDELLAINAFNAKHFTLPPKLDHFAEINPFVYHRVFSRGSLAFDLGGRLYAPFQNLHSHERGKIICDGEGVVERDYSAIHFRLAYAESGIDCGPGDLYDLKGHPVTRKEVKTAVMVLLNAPNIRKAKKSIEHNVEDRRRREAHEIAVDKEFASEEALVEALHEAQARVRVLTPEDVTALVEALKRRHPVVAHYLHSDAGLRLQNTDAKIALRVLRKMHVQGIPCLGVHDSFITKASKDAELCRAMEEAYEEVTGYKPVVK